MPEHDHPPGQHPLSPAFLKNTANENELLRFLWDSSPCGIIIIAPGPSEKVPIIIGDCNHVTCQTHGYTRDEMVGQSMDLLHEVPWTPTVDQSWFTSPKLGETLNGFSLHRSKDGSVFRVEYSLTFVSIGGVRCAIGFDKLDDQSEDLTAKHGIANRWINAMESSEEGVWEYDIKKQTLWTSPRWQWILGYPQRETTHALPHLLEAVHRADRQRLIDCLQQAGDDQIRSVELEIRVKSKTNEWLWLHLAGKVSYRSNGNPDKILGSMRDISESKRVFEDLRIAREEADKANTAKSQFLAAMSHEIRTPMNGVLGIASLLGDTKLDDEQRTYLKTISESGDALLSIIDEILHFSKLEAGAVELENKEFDLVNCMYQSLAVVRPLAVEKGLELNFDVAPTTPLQVRGDSARLRQVVVNLLGNAVKFTDEGEIKISLSSSHLEPPSHGDLAQSICIEIADTGIGIPAEKIPLLFEPFSQADASTTRQYGGTGLGLAICKSIIELMEGSISATSEPQKGSAFRCEIPFQTNGKPVLSLNPKLEGKQALVVTDSPSLASSLNQSLQAIGLAPETVGNKLEALLALENDAPYACVFIDLDLKAEHAEELSRSIKLQHQRYPLPIIALSSVQKLHPSNSIGALFETRLVKPLSPTKITETIETILLGEKAAEESSEPSYQATEEQFHPEKVLIVEDNAVNQLVAARLLNKFGYRPDLADNGFKALDRCIEKSYDIIFMDIQMPGINGYETLKRIFQRHTNETPKPWVIALTANAMRGDRELCLEAGMNDYLTKPIRPEELAKALQRARAQVAQRASPSA